MNVTIVGVIACVMAVASSATAGVGPTPTAEPALAVAQAPPPDAPRPAPPPESPRPAPPAPPPPREDAQRPHPPADVDRPAPVPPPAVRMEGTIYELALDEKAALSLDAARLAREFPALSAFDAEMRRLGAARVLYRLDQGVIFGGRREVRISSDQPYVSAVPSGASRKSASAPSEVVTSLARKDVGAEFRLGGYWFLEGEVPVLAIELVLDMSSVTEGPVTLADVHLPVFRSLTQQYSGRVRFGEPIVLLTVDAAQNDRSARAVAYVTRIVFHPN